MSFTFHNGYDLIVAKIVSSLISHFSERSSRLHIESSF